MHRPDSRPIRLRALRRRAVVVQAAALGLLAVLPAAAIGAAPNATASTAAGRHIAAGARPRAPFPNGTANRREPSRLAPPSAAALPGYRRIYVDDFGVPLSPRMWFLFRGQPSGDPSGYFAPSHVSVHGGELRIRTFRDRAYGGGWISGGVGLYRVHPTYGAFFVRSRQTGMGPDNVELLWPANNQWPPEVDFNETGIDPLESTWTVHYHSPGSQDYFTNWRVNMTHWHTWGVIWTPTSLTFTLDGRRWGPRLTKSWEIPHLPMTLDMQQQSFCGINPACPTHPTTLVVDWVAIYVPRR